MAATAHALPPGSGAGPELALVLFRLTLCVTTPSRAGDIALHVKAAKQLRGLTPLEELPKRLSGLLQFLLRRGRSILAVAILLLIIILLLRDPGIRLLRLRVLPSADSLAPTQLPRVFSVPSPLIINCWGCCPIQPSHQSCQFN